MILNNDLDKKHAYAKPTKKIIIDLSCLCNRRNTSIIYDGRRKIEPILVSDEYSDSASDADDA